MLLSCVYNKSLKLLIFKTFLNHLIESNLSHNNITRQFIFFFSLIRWHATTSKDGNGYHCNKFSKRICLGQSIRKKMVNSKKQRVKSMRHVCNVLLEDLSSKKRVDCTCSRVPSISTPRMRWNCDRWSFYLRYARVMHNIRNRFQFETHQCRTQVLYLEYNFGIFSYFLV